MEWQPRLNKVSGWGSQGDAVSADEAAVLALLAREQFGATDSAVAPLTAADFSLPPSKVVPPESLSAITTDRRADRLAHASGKSFPDLARARTGRVDHAPDLVAYPRTEADISELLDWAAAELIAVIPYGGGSSVVGGVTPDVGPGYRGSLSLDLQRLDRVLEVDPVSRAARAQAGVLGPDLARQLKSSGLALRHYPQSYQYSTLGGWIATRAGGHYATGPTHIDDFVEAVRVISPAGTWQTRRLPAAGAGPDPNRLMLGSEGTLGILTEAWIRLQPRPGFRAAATVRFDSLPTAVAAVREIAQAGLNPANLRLLDRVEARNALVADGTAEVLVIGFESADHDVAGLLDRALECTGDHGGVTAPSRAPADRDSVAADSDTPRPRSAQAWRDAFLRMPYYRDELLGYGIISETFETAVTWDRFEALHAAVTTAVTSALAAERLAPATVSCRFTHVYPDGVAPYFTVLARGTHGDLDRQWWTVKQAASEAIMAAGGTITHHHGVGRDHVPWYRQERPDLFAAALAGAGRELDPAGIMNPGVLGLRVGR
ncbi:MAG: alkyldihydroxyacetonephosphate synthase [Actinomycetota bacterium]|jgi:alkyldihydroxyacetonephosphate synthase|nr:alkyldihydroxyacetonephosphate synthase [Actinomycetota bacterium]